MSQQASTRTARSGPAEAGGRRRAVLALGTAFAALVVVAPPGQAAVRAPQAATAATATPAPATTPAPAASPAPAATSAPAATAGATGPAGPLTQTSWVVWLDLVGDRLAVEQDVELTNPGSAPYAGQGSAAGLPAGMKPVLRLPLVPGAGNLEYVGQFEGCCTAVEANVVVLAQPVKPGTSSGTVRYEVAFTPQLELAVPLPVPGLTVLVPPGLRLDSPQLTSSGTSSDRGITYQVMRTSTLAPGAVVRLNLTRVPQREARTWWGWAAGGVVALVLAGAVFGLRRRRPRPVPRAGTPRAQEVDLLIEEIALLDLAFDRGALPDAAAYRRVRAAVLERLRAAEVGSGAAERRRKVVTDRATR